MKQAVWLSDDDLPRWDAFVDVHPLGGLAQTSVWRRALERSFSHVGGQFCAVVDDKTGEIFAGLPVYTVRSWLLGNRLVCVPFATLCDPLAVSEADFELLIPLLLELRKEEGAKYIEIRAHRGAAMFRHLKFRASLSYRHHFLRLGGSPEESRRGFSRIVRRSIKKAQAANIHIRKARTKQDLTVFYELLSGTRKRLGLPLIPMRFFDCLWDELVPVDAISVLLAHQAEMPVGALFAIRWRGVYALEYIGDTEALRGQGVMYLLYWEALKEAVHLGCETLSFGRTYRGNRGLLQFKEQWGTESEDLCTFFYPPATHKDAEDREASWQYRLIKFLARHSPPLASRWLGEFCYQHMG